MVIKNFKKCLLVFCFICFILTPFTGSFQDTKLISFETEDQFGLVHLGKIEHDGKVFYTVMRNGKSAMLTIQ